jgi:hypothetical protein
MHWVHYWGRFYETWNICHFFMHWVHHCVLNWGRGTKMCVLFSGSAIS